MSNPRHQPNRRSFFSKGTPKPKKKKSFPDLNKDGKITKADILKGRGVFASGSKNPNAIKSIKPTLGLKRKNQYLMDRINKKKIGTKKK
jgi:hypothetical protein